MAKDTYSVWWIRSVNVIVYTHKKAGIEKKNSQKDY